MGVFAITVMAVVVITLVVLSPLMLNQLESLPGLDWLQLSYIGQTYGAASALLTGLALLGVAGSLLFQVRAIQASREQSSREHHAHLVEMALKDPAYQRCWGDDPEAHASPDDYRQRVYLNLIVSYWERDYLIGALDERAVRHGVAHLFQGEAARHWWADVGSHRVQMARTHRARHFSRVVDDEYKIAVASGPPQVPAEGTSQSLAGKGQQTVLSSDVLKTGSAVLVGALGGLIFSRALQRHIR
jgi:hypothetical protein